MTTRVWTNGTGLAISAANLNSLEDDMDRALGVPDAALAARVVAGATKTALDAAYVNEADNTTALNGKVGKGDLVYNAKDYGAKGTGTGSDTAAIQAAINAAFTAGGGVVYLPKGIYNLSITTETDNTSLITGDTNGVGVFTNSPISSCLVLRAGVSLIGAGVGITTLQRSTNATAVLGTLDYRDGTVANMSISGPGVTTTTHGIFMYVSSSSGNMNKNVTFKNLEIYNMGNYGIGHQYGSPQNLRYEDIWIHDVGDDGIDHKVRNGPIDYLNNGTDGSFFDNILVERWGSRLTDASALDIRGQCTISNIVARDFGTTGNRLYGITLTSGIANGVDKRAAATRTTLTNFYIEGKPGFDCVGLSLNTSGHEQVSNGHIRWCTSYGVWARATQGAPTQAWVNGANVVGVTVEGSGTGPSMQLETRTSVVGCRALSDIQYFDAERGNLVAGQTSFALWATPTATRYLVKNGATLAEGTDFSISGSSVTLTAPAAISDHYYFINPASGGVVPTGTGCLVVGFDTDNWASGVLAGPTALANTIQSGNRVGSGPQLSNTISGGIPRLQVVNAGSSNIDLTLLPANAGYVRYGTFTTNADTPITGYVSIKDAGGTVRKLAVIA